MRRKRRSSGQSFFCAPDQLKKYLEDENYAGAAATKENVDALSATIARVVPANRNEKEEEDEEEETRQAELRRAKDQLKKCREDEDYRGAADAKDHIATLMSAEPCSQHNHGRDKADWSAVRTAGHGSQTATGPIVASAAFARADEEEEKRRAELLCAQEQLVKCLEEKDCRGAAAAK